MAKLTGILESIGWRSASDVPASTMAAELDQILGAAAGGDPIRLRRTVAECLRGNAHPLDGSSTPVTAWMPTAAEIIRRSTE